MTGTEWLERNKEKLIDCPLGRVTESACKKRVYMLKHPHLWKQGYNYYGCDGCPRSEITDISALAYRNYQILEEV